MPRKPNPRRKFDKKREQQKKDNDLILQLQQDYFLLRDFQLHKNSQTEKDLIIAMQNCAKRFIHSERIKKNLYISLDDIEIKSLGAAAYIMEQYYKRPDFKLGTPSAYIRLRCMAELYRHKKIEEYIKYTDRDL